MLATLLFVLIPAAARAKLPVAISKCLAAHPEVAFANTQKPPFLQVHFHRLGQAEYVLSVLVRKSAQTHALVCSPDGTGVLLGAAGEPPFSDMYNDNYMSDKWRVCTLKDILEMRKLGYDVPEPENEAVLLTWEDGGALIYWDGKRFRWKSLEP